MTDPDYTAIAVLMDRSGSMDAIRADAEGALRAFIAAQAAQPGRCTIRMAHFDSEYETVYPSTPIAQAPPYTLVPRATTALLDGIGRLVVEFGAELSALPEPDRPGTVIVIIQTDGEENSSREWTRERVFELITHQRERYGWEFVFLAAGQDAIATGASLGVAVGSALSWDADPDGVCDAVDAMTSWVTRRRSGGPTEFTDAERRGERS